MTELSLVVVCVVLGVVALASIVHNAVLHRRIEARALERHEAWRESDRARMENELRSAADARARAELSGWRSAHETRIRRDALARSRASSTGKSSEHLAPYFDEFPFDPRDARFLGSPVDFLVFDGLGRGHLRDIVFAEVKTGPAAGLSARERQVRDAVEAGRVRWEEIRLADAPADAGEGSFYLVLEEDGGEGSGQLELLPAESKLRHWREWTESPREYELGVDAFVRRSGKTCLRLSRVSSGNERFALSLGSAARLDVDLANGVLRFEDDDGRAYRLGADVLSPGPDELLLVLQGGR